MFSGRFIDWVGPRQGFTLAVLIWSLAGIFTSFAQSVLAFSFFRFLLGAAESGNFPGGAKVLAEWFPARERTTAVGVFTSGVSIGAMLTPPVAAYLIVHYGWQVAFVAVGVPGLLWILVWRAVYRPAPADPDETLGTQVAGRENTTPLQDSENRRWSFLLRQRLTWAVILGRFVEEPVGWLFYSWLPLYLNKFLGVTLMNTGLLLTIPFIAQDLGFILGGWGASRLMKTGWSVDKTRRCMIFLSALCMMSPIVSIAAPTPLVFVLLISVATFGHGSWSSNIMSMPGDIVPPGAVGTLYGLSGCGGALGSILFMHAVGTLVDAQNSFDMVFLIGGILPLTAAIVMFTVGGKIQRLPSLQVGSLQRL
jgi:ACS family hexuronate transporter-like MFS transporter